MNNKELTELYNEQFIRIKHLEAEVALKADYIKRLEAELEMYERDETFASLAIRVTELEDERDDYRNQYHMAEAKVLSRDALLEQLTEEQLTQDLAKAEAENEALRDGHEEIIMWGKAYPLGVFPEPDQKKAHKLLKAGGMTLDAVSASAMRHVLKGVVRIAKDALLTGEQE